MVESERSMNVGILVKEFSPDVVGGMEVQTMRMAQELSKKHNVTIFTKNYGKSSQVGDGYEIVRIPNIRFNNFLSTLTFVIISFMALLRHRNKIDVLQCMMIYPSGFIGLITNKLANIPFFSWIRGGDWYFAKNNPVKRKMISSVLRNSLVVVQSNKIKQDVEKEFPDAKLKVIPNAVDISEYRANGEKVIFVGNLIKRKGVRYLIEAMKEVNSKLVIIGDGEERENLEELSEELNVDCDFVGEIPSHQVTEYLRDGKLLVLPAIEGEGFPNVILEAMSVGLPVVATKLAGIPDLVRDGETGFLVEPANPKELANKINKIIRDEDLLKEMSDNCLEEVKKYSWDNIIGQVEEVYRVCVG